jgi:hypothetical protein
MPHLKYFTGKYSAETAIDQSVFNLEMWRPNINNPFATKRIYILNLENVCKAETDVSLNVGTYLLKSEIKN